MKVIRYRCPYCKIRTNKMELLEKRYSPSIDELKKFPDVAGEFLRCKCGRILKWIEMEKIEIDYEGELI